MKKQDILSILITLFAGFIAGMYLYVTGFAGITAKLEVSTAEEYSKFVIEGEIYGGCRSRCSSFQLLSDGSYRYLIHPRNAEGSQLKQGTLPLNLRRSLRDALSAPTLVAQSRTSSRDDCASFTDGTDVRYEITLDGIEYTLDSCSTRVDGQSEAWQSLLAVWTYLDEAGNNE